MKKVNAHVLLELDAVNAGHPIFRSVLTRKIIFEVCINAGVLDMRRLFKSLDVTPIAARLRLKELEDAGIFTISTDAQNKRCKIIYLTDHGASVVSDYERSVQAALKNWRAVAIFDHPPDVLHGS